MPLRVVGGAERGRPLQAPKGTDVRPTMDRVKGVIFSMLEAEAYKRGFGPDDEGRMAAGLAWPRVVDLFAGSGGLGIEALSRGAEHVDFVDTSKASVEAVRLNLAKLGMEAQSTVHQASANEVLKRLTAFDLILIDPPYADQGSLTAALDVLRKSEALGTNGVIVLEQASSASPPAAIGAFHQAKTRAQGATRITLYLHQSKS
jgi:16S rRNA (guanine966-N2)-methyltransferase